MDIPPFGTVHHLTPTSRLISSSDGKWIEIVKKHWLSYSLPIAQMVYGVGQSEIFLRPVLGELNFVHVHSTCESDLFISRENRGFSSLPINLVLDLFHSNLFKYREWINVLLQESYDEKDLENAEEFVKDLYLTVIAISGFLNEFSYASDIVKTFICDIYKERMDERNVLLPLWGKQRWVRLVCIA